MTRVLLGLGLWAIIYVALMLVIFHEQPQHSPVRNPDAIALPATSRSTARASQLYTPGARDELRRWARSVIRPEHLTGHEDWFDHPVTSDYFRGIILA